MSRPQSPAGEDLHSLHRSPAMTAGRERQVLSTSTEGLQDHVIVNRMLQLLPQRSYSRPGVAASTLPESSSPRGLNSSRSHGREISSEAASVAASRPPAIVQSNTLQRLGVAANGIVTQHSRLASLREQALPLRDQVSYYRHEYYQQREYAADSIQNALTLLQELPGDVPLSELVDQLRSHLDVLEQDQKRLSKEDSRAHGLEAALSAIEYQTLEEESRLKLFTQEALDIIKVINIPLAEEMRASVGMSDLDDSPDLHNVDQTPEVHPILQDYYDKLGEAKIMHDRVVDFGVAYGEARTRRIFNEEQERFLELTREEFEGPWERKRERLEQVRRQTIEIADAARAACVQAGLDPDAYKRDLSDQGVDMETIDSGDDVGMVHTASVDDMASPHQFGVAFPRPQLIKMFNPPPVAYLQTDQRPESPSGHGAGKYDIERWRQDVYAHGKEPIAVSANPLRTDDLQPCSPLSRHSWPQMPNYRNRMSNEQASNLRFARKIDDSFRSANDAFQRRHSSESELGQYSQAQPYSYRDTPGNLFPARYVGK